MSAKENGEPARQCRCKHLWTREELVLWLTYEKAKEPVKSSPSLGPTFPTYINLHTCAYISHVYVCTCMACTLLTRGPPRWLGSSRCNEKVGGNLARALGVKMIYVIRLIKRLSARWTSEASPGWANFRHRERRKEKGIQWGTIYSNVLRWIRNGGQVSRVEQRSIIRLLNRQLPNWKRDASRDLICRDFHEIHRNVKRTSISWSTEIL